MKFTTNLEKVPVEPQKLSKMAEKKGTLVNDDSSDSAISKKSALSQYEEGLKALRRTGRAWNLSDQDIDRVISQNLKLLKMRECTARTYGTDKCITRHSLSFVQSVVSLVKFCIKTVLIIIVSIVLIYAMLQHKPTQYFIQSKLQDFIYPGMKMLRKAVLPLISAYPSLTDWYDESCLLENPYFRVPDMPCLCENVRSVLNLTGEDTKKELYHSGIPYILKVDVPEVSWMDMKDIYLKNRKVFDRDANRVFVSSPQNPSVWSTPAQIFTTDWGDKTESSHSHLAWRSNRMEPSRLLRSVFGLPLGEPNFASGITIEKYVLIDGPKVPSHAMPTTDGSTVFVMQSYGARLVVLTPAPECAQHCPVVSVLLPSSHILWYSWWYWRASSFPVPDEGTFNIAYMGSYL